VVPPNLVQTNTKTIDPTHFLPVNGGFRPDLLHFGFGPEAQGWSSCRS